MKRLLGRSGIEVSALGMGCWAIGGPFTNQGKPCGWGQVDDDESVRAIHRALDLGVNFFDTADVYGCGHSERVLGRALGSKRDNVVIATKFGMRYDEDTREIKGTCGDPDYVRQCCEDSLQRMQRDFIDVYQFHVGNYDPEDALVTRQALEDLVAAGKIRWYGWSTDNAERATVFAEGEHCTSIQHRLNVFTGHVPALEVCEQTGLASINKGPLAMGLLSGKFTSHSEIPIDDVRHHWDLREGKQAEQLKQLGDLREVLTSGGRTLVQGALAWVWAHSDHTIPIPGFKTGEQVEENIKALQYGPLSHAELVQIESILRRKEMPTTPAR